MSAPVPQRLRLRRAARVLELDYADGRREALDWEYLRVCSPSAEVRGHGGEPRSLPGKRGVTLLRVEPVGRYAVRLVFDDGHDSGLYSWDVFHDLVVNRERHWQAYLDGLARHGMSRDSDILSLSALTAQRRRPEPEGD